MLQLSNLEVVYNDTLLVLRGISLSVPAGQIVALLGGNGAGKTTTLRAISGLLKVHEGDITKGHIKFNGEDLARRDPAEIVELGKVDFGGLAPAQTWSGDPNDYIVRETYIFKPRVANYVEGPIGTGHTGSELLEGPFASQAAKDYDFEADGACYKAAG